MEAYDIVHTFLGIKVDGALPDILQKSGISHMSFVRITFMAINQQKYSKTTDVTALGLENGYVVPCQASSRTSD